MAEHEAVPVHVLRLVLSPMIVIDAMGLGLVAVTDILTSAFPLNTSPLAREVIAIVGDVAPNFYPSGTGVGRLPMTCWTVMAAVRCAEPSAERSAAERRVAA
jgi:hypothetical protein